MAGAIQVCAVESFSFDYRKINLVHGLGNDDLVSTIPKVPATYKRIYKLLYEVKNKRNCAGVKPSCL